MELTSSNITKLLNESNKIFERHLPSFKLYFGGILDTSNRETIARLKLSSVNTNSIYKNCSILIHNNSNVDIEIYENIHIKYTVNLSKKVEIVQLITLILPDLMLFGVMPTFTITQSISGWTNAKVVRNVDDRWACIHTTVVKQAMQNGLVKVKNAKLGKNGSIIVDYSKCKPTNYHVGPSDFWCY